MKIKQMYISVIITFVFVLAIGVFIAVEPSGKLLDKLLNNPLICLAGLFLIAAIWFIVMISIDATAKNKIIEKRPQLFEEMQSILRSTLIPLGFTEEEEQLGWVKEDKYSHGELTVSLMTHIADLEFMLSASSKSESKDGQQNPIHDFIVNGHLSKPDEFKDEGIAKLNTWLSKKNK